MIKLTLSLLMLSGFAFAEDIYTLVPPIKAEEEYDVTCIRLEQKGNNAFRVCYLPDNVVCYIHVRGISCLQK